MSQSFYNFDVIVIGSGHAGRTRGALEAQLRAAMSARGSSRGPGDVASAGRASVVTQSGNVCSAVFVLMRKRGVIRRACGHLEIADDF